MTGWVARSVISLIVLAVSSSLGVTAAELTFDLRLEQGQVPDNMRLIRVHEGDVVRLRCTTDQPLVLHLHGYDIKKRVIPGTVTELRFTARVAGRFPVHVHPLSSQGWSLAHEDRSLVDVEVYPR
jgi:hypothetical protein